ncbi:MAG: oxidoreductase [Caulobacter sp.]|nr:oxidoreductase [Caulobacter sp.]
MALDRRALIVSSLALAAGPSLARAAALPPAEGDMVLGSPKAKVQVVEYASASCPHCAHWFTDEFPKLRKAFIDTGQVWFVFREFLTQPADFAAAGFLLARRVGEARYFEVMAAIFQKQAAIYESNDLWGGLLAIAKSFGLTEDQFKAALQDPKSLAALNARVEKASARDKVEVTPTFFVNGARVTGDVSFEALSAAIVKATKA